MGKIIQDKDSRKTIIYTRVSSSGQKDHLKNQVVFLKGFANAKGIIVDEIFKDIGSGLNYNRKKWNKLLEDCIFNNETLSSKAEMVQDLINITHVFSCRIMDLENIKRKLRRMMKLLKAYKTAINPQQIQKQKVQQSIGTCRYYVSVLIDVKDNNDYSSSHNQGVGIDLGIKDLAIVNTMDKPFKNINKTKEVKKVEKKLKREQKKLSRKYESLKIRSKRINKEGGNATRQNIQKQVVTVQKLHQKLSNIRDNYVNQVVNEIVKTKPSYITIEDLNIKGMMKNRHLAKAIAKQNFYGFRVKLTNRCKITNIELRFVDRWYPSSKICSECGSIKKDLNLSNRIYMCPTCGIILDRDKNASINLANAKIYKVA